MTDTNNVASVTPTDPDANTPVLIRNGHTVTIDGANRASGNLQIQTTGVLDCGGYTGLNFGVVTNPVNGSGKIRISIPGAPPATALTAAFPSGDFSEFTGTNGGTVEYYTPADRDLLIPVTSGSGDALNNYRHLIVSPATGRYITTPNRNLTVYGNMTVQGQSATGIVRLNTAAVRNLTINGNLTVTSGDLQFQNGQSQTITIGGNASIGADLFDVQNTGATTNTLILSGNLTNNGTLNFNNSGSCDITFTGSASTSLTGTGNTTLGT